MSWGKTPSVPKQPDRAGLEEDQVSNSQEAVPVPYLAGERKVALRWISRVYNQRAKEAPIERPGKK